MKSFIIELEDNLYDLLAKAAPSGERRKADFIRRALVNAIVEAEEEKTRAAYRKMPDSAAEAADWSDAEEFRP